MPERKGGRLPLRCRRQSLVRAGAWGEGSTASWSLDRAGKTHRQDSAARTLRQTFASAAIKRNRLFMAASHSLYSLYVGTQGVRGG